MESRVGVGVALSGEVVEPVDEKGGPGLFQWCVHPRAFIQKHGNHIRSFKKDDYFNIRAKLFSPFMWPEQKQTVYVAMT